MVARRGEEEERRGGRRWCIQYLAYIQRKMLNELGGKTTLACASFCRANGATITDVEYLLYNGRSAKVSRLS